MFHGRGVRSVDYSCMIRLFQLRSIGAVRIIKTTRNPDKKGEIMNRDLHLIDSPGTAFVLHVPEMFAHLTTIASEGQVGSLVNKLANCATFQLVNLRHFKIFKKSASQPSGTYSYSFTYIAHEFTIIEKY